MDRRPQFNLKRLLIVVSFLAIAFAIAGPFIRRMTWAKQQQLLILWACVLLPIVVSAVSFYFFELRRVANDWKLEFTLGLQSSKAVWWAIALICVAGFLLLNVHISVLWAESPSLLHICSQSFLCGIQLAMFLNTFLRQRYGVTLYDGGFCDSMQTPHPWSEVKRFSVNRNLRQIVLFLNQTVLTVPLGEEDADAVESFLQARIAN